MDPSMYQGMRFGHAISAMEAGMRVRRAGWNGKGMWLALVKPPPFRFCLAQPMRVLAQAEATVPYYAEAGIALPPTIIMRAADGSHVAWLASQTDILARDWETVDEREPL
jgi:hypothetical protein